jgi:flavorubredoxin
VPTRIDHITGGIYRISTIARDSAISFNQFLIDDERPTLIHTGEHAMYEHVRDAIREVLDPARLAHVALLHWEGDEAGGMTRFLAEAPGAQLVGSPLSIELNARAFGITDRVQGYMDGATLELGAHRLRFIETPHVHHWDSMMVFEETTGSLFPADLYIQPGDQPAVVTEDLSDAMITLYRGLGIFAHEKPVRETVDELERLAPRWVHAMHGGTIGGDALAPYTRALREREFGFNGMLLGRRLRAPATVG